MNNSKHFKPAFAGHSCTFTSDHQNRKPRQAKWGSGSVKAPAAPVALGVKLDRCSDVRSTTALPPKAEVHPRSCYVAKVPISDIAPLPSITRSGWRADQQIRQDRNCKTYAHAAVDTNGLPIWHALTAGKSGTMLLADRG